MEPGDAFIDTLLRDHFRSYAEDQARERLVYEVTRPFEWKAVRTELYHCEARAWFDARTGRIHMQLRDVRPRSVRPGWLEAGYLLAVSTLEAHVDA
jgi:hypothetical protein